MAHVFAHSHSLGLGIAVVAQRLVLVPDESGVGQLLVAVLAPEAVRMPVGGHGLDHPTHHEFTALVAARSEEHLKVPLAVLAALELVEHAVGERPEALGAPTSETTER